MKIIASDNQLEITDGVVAQIILTVLAELAGVVLIIIALVTKFKSSNTQPFPLLPLIVGIVLLLAGGLIISFAKSRRFVLQLGGDTTITAKRVLGGAPSVQSFPTSSIVAVRLFTTESATGSSQLNQVGGLDQFGNSNQTAPTRQSALSLLLSNNDIVMVGRKSGATGMGIGSVISRAPLTKEANQLAEFLGLPLDAEDTSSLLGEVKMIKQAANIMRAPAATPNPVVPSTAPPVSSTPAVNSAYNPSLPPQPTAPTMVPPAAPSPPPSDPFASSPPQNLS